MEDLQIAPLYDYQTDESIFENLGTLESDKGDFKPFDNSLGLNSNESTSSDLPDRTNNSDLPLDSRSNSSDSKHNEQTKQLHDSVTELKLQSEQFDGIFPDGKEFSKTSSNENITEESEKPLNTMPEDIENEANKTRNDDNDATRCVEKNDMEKESDQKLIEEIPKEDICEREKALTGVEEKRKDHTNIANSASDYKSPEINTKANIVESMESENFDLTHDDSAVEKGCHSGVAINSVKGSTENEIVSDKTDVIHVEDDTIGADVEIVELHEDDEKEKGENQEHSEDKKVGATGKQPVVHQTDKDIQIVETETNDEEMDDEYFNPLLLCPEVSMAVDEAPVIQGGNNQSEGTTSPLPYEESFMTYVDEMTGAEISFNLTREEQEMRAKMYGPNNPIQFTKIHCTACNVHLGSALQGQKNRFVHPMLKVIICKDCHHFYTSGEFEKDEDGSELYCRWCGQGGQVICCSKCEYVFCKKCIRTNVGRKKLNEIRDSDEWCCFRCDQSQLSVLRATCYEIFDYVRRELLRASTLNDPSFMVIDHTRCCGSSAHGKKKKLDLEHDMERKRRRLSSSVDPDYNPHSEQDDESSAVKACEAPEIGKPVTASVKKAVYSNKLNAQTIIPMRGALKVTANGSGDTKTTNQPEITNLSNVRATSSAFIIPRTYRSNIPAPGQPTPQLPPGIRLTSVGRVPLIQPKPSSQPAVNKPQSQVSGLRAAPAGVKHDWFEKTVRAAARVNSNLSYTLTQLNKAQSGADSIESLATVHNKLQEILSNSINSLIQIRKNLRTEFIAGIKTIKFPSKPITDNNADDDVILITPEPDKLPPPALALKKVLRTAVTPTKPEHNPLDVGATFVGTINQSNQILRDNKEKNNSGTECNKPKAYLKVRTFSQLQMVPSECITIPDDTQTADYENTKKDVDQAKPQTIKQQFVLDEEVEDDEVKKMSSVKVRLTRCDDVDKLAKEQSIGDTVDKV